VISNDVVLRAEVQRENSVELQRVTRPESLKEPGLVRVLFVAALLKEPGLVWGDCSSPPCSAPGRSCRPTEPPGDRASRHR